MRATNAKTTIRNKNMRTDNSEGNVNNHAKTIFCSKTKSIY